MSRTPPTKAVAREQPTVIRIAPQAAPDEFAAFVAASARGKSVPVVRRILADLLTPLGAYLRLREQSEYAFMLESVTGGKRAARYSFVGAAPHTIALWRADDALEITRADGTRELEPDADIVSFMREHFAPRELAATTSGLPPFAGGAVGYIGYSAARKFLEREKAAQQSQTKISAVESLPQSAIRNPQSNHPPAHAGGSDSALPQSDISNPQSNLTDAHALLLICRSVIVFDHARNEALIVTTADVRDAGDDPLRLREIYDAAQAETRRLAGLLQADDGYHLPPALTANETDGVAREVEFSANQTRAEFESAVLEIKERIAAGDCYQAVLAQRFSAEVSCDAAQIYRALRALNPSPYMFLFQLPQGEHIIGASPEMLVRCEGENLFYRPIAGTRPRGTTEVEDVLLGAELAADEKECAEHLMLVDLGRNDLGRVAAYGSVAVEQLMQVERYSHVQHLVTRLSARLAEGRDRFDALTACFPAGTVTGAPKVAAMRIIESLEPTPRGLYAGAILYADYAGNLDACIAIRTIVVREGRAYVQAGAGIVADSVPENEYLETINKARALMRAISNAEAGASKVEREGSGVKIQSSKLKA